MDRIPILKMGNALIVTIQIDMSRGEAGWAIEVLMSDAQLQLRLNDTIFVNVVQSTEDTPWDWPR